MICICIILLNISDIVFVSFKIPVIVPEACMNLVCHLFMWNSHTLTMNTEHGELDKMASKIIAYGLLIVYVSLVFSRWKY